MGIALLVLALVSIPWLVPATRGATDLRDGFVRTFGLLVFVFIAVLAYLGLAGRIKLLTVNGQAETGRERALDDGDRVKVFPVVVGG